MSGGSDELKTSYDALAEIAEADPDRPFLHQPLEGEVLTWSRAEALHDARCLANAMLAIGLEPGDRVAILSKNCAEWVICDIALCMAGLISVPIYPTAGRDTIAFVMAHSEARAIFLGKLDDPDAVADALPDDVLTISMRYPSIECIHEWQSLVDAAQPIEEPPRPRPSDPMTILYTSGSTGRPKGVVISYGAYDYACRTTADITDVTPDDRALSYLPLSHITERTVIAGPAIYNGMQLFFSDSLKTFGDDIRRARPTKFISVPRLWVQFQSAVHRDLPPARLNLLLKVPIVGKAVARKIREQLGLDQTERFGSGTAPISPETLRWYQKIGIDIGEGWGMSETSGLSCTNSPYETRRLGTIGVPLPGTEMKLSDAGEILLRSPGLLTEYYKDPELTAASFDQDGFFHTGDKGEWDEAASAFRITGRIKDSFKSAKGKYVSPVPIEGKLAGNPFIEQVCVMGTGLRAPVAVVGLSLAAREESRDVITTSLDTTRKQVNEALESHERLAHVYVVDDPWSIENDLLTPTMKLKRDKVEDRYKSMIQAEERDHVVWADV